MDPGGDGGDGLSATGLFCGSCGAQSSPTAKFCSECGTPLKQATQSAEYKQVTVLFADVVHSMDIAATVGAERLREIMAELASRCAAVVQQFGGTVDKFTGDGIMAVFGASTALEDHAIRACLAALGVQEAATQLFFFVEAVGSGPPWSDTHLKCIGHLYKDELRMNATQKQQDGYIAKRKNEIAKGCPMLTGDERARPTVNIAQRCGGVIASQGEPEDHSTAFRSD